MSEGDRLRIDKWLWAARFFKTRSLASAAVESGKVLAGGIRVKPAKAIGLGDQLEIRNESGTFVVYVRGLADRRGSASVAQLLYEETEASKAARTEAAAQRRLNPAPDPYAKGRPTKKDRRKMERLREDW
jgi:ribosome-associated heat shock protein Hsp15